MRATSTLVSASLAVSLVSVPAGALAQDATEGAEDRPAQPSWPDSWATSSEQPDDTEGEASASETADPQRESSAEQASDESEREQNSAPLDEAAEQGEPILTPGTVDLRAPHAWMVAGGVVIGVSSAAALALGILLDRPDLAGASFALGGLLGVASLTVGVVMQNNRLEAAGVPATPSGAVLKLSLAY